MVLASTGTVLAVTDTVLASTGTVLASTVTVLAVTNIFFCMTLFSHESTPQESGSDVIPWLS